MKEKRNSPHSSERVEYKIKMPGQVRGEYVYLPIDSKFPDGYYWLEEAYESGEKERWTVSQTPIG